MRDYTVKFTEIDRLILESYKTLLDGLGDYLGDGYELVLHSLENLDSSVIKIINGYHTGRKEGAPITDLALCMLNKLERNNGKDFSVYFTKNKNGDPIKAATIIIRGEKNKAIGLLCMNFYLNTDFADIISNFIFSEKAEETVADESFVKNTDELIESAVEKTRLTVNADSKILPSLKNKETVVRLYRQGVFELKDAVAKTAKCMGISKNTVYMHIRSLQASEKP